MFWCEYLWASSGYNCLYSVVILWAKPNHSKYTQSISNIFPIPIIFVLYLSHFNDGLSSFDPLFLPSIWAILDHFESIATFVSLSAAGVPLLVHLWSSTNFTHAYLSNQVSVCVCVCVGVCKFTLNCKTTNLIDQIKLNMAAIAPHLLPVCLPVSLSTCLSVCLTDWLTDWQWHEWERVACAEMMPTTTATKRATTTRTQALNMKCEKNVAKRYSTNSCPHLH